MDPVRISLQTWLNYLTADPAGRVSCVANTKQRYGTGYSPAFDFWRSFRTAYVDGLRTGDVASSVESTISTLSDKRKIGGYRLALAGHEAWTSKSDVEWRSNTPASTWTDGELIIRVNPEAIINVNGESFTVKFHLGARTALDPKRVEPAIGLVNRLIEEADLQCRAGVVDVVRGTLHSRNRIKRLDALMAGEAASFMAIWRALPQAPAA